MAEALAQFESSRKFAADKTIIRILAWMELAFI
jgi:hypothetical protein